MSKIFLNFFMIIYEIIKPQVFILIVSILVVSVYYKKVKKIIIFLFVMYLEIFLIFFPINKYGADIFTIYFLKKKLSPESFIFFKENQKIKEKKSKIISAYYLSRDIKHMTKKIKKEEEELKIALENTKGIDKTFLPWIDTMDKI